MTELGKKGGGRERRRGRATWVGAGEGQGKKQSLSSGRYITRKMTDKTRQDKERMRGGEERRRKQHLTEANPEPVGVKGREMRPSPRGGKGWLKGQGATRKITDKTRQDKGRKREEERRRKTPDRGRP
jgi:hypothetical protein